MASWVSSPLFKSCLLTLAFLFVLRVVWMLPRSQNNIFSHQEDSQFHLVISHRKKDPNEMRAWFDAVRAMTYIEELGSKVTIYTTKPQANLEKLKNQTAADYVIQLPNAGREQGTHMHHISKMHHRLRHYTFFSQEWIVALNTSKSPPCPSNLGSTIAFNTNSQATQTFSNLEKELYGPVPCRCGHYPSGYFPNAPTDPNFVG
ncbi:hypothetical protein MMC28_005793 [Mycoblastus sanguinarius]|nr:hypothetical protein [Mycoblastus sanguinarius]